MPSDNPFKWRQFEPALILQCVRWYLRYALSYRDLKDMMRERGLCVDHTTIYRWVQRYAPEIDKRCRPFLRRTNDSYRIDETYVRVAGAWTYLYRGVDSNGDTLDFVLRATRDRKAAIAFFRKTLGAAHTTPPRVVTVDKNPAYPVAFEAVRHEGLVRPRSNLRQCKYLNNIIEQDHRFMALLRGSKTDPQRPLPTDPLTTDSVRRRPTKLSHLIEDVTCEDGLRLLPRPTARSKALPDDQLVPEEGVLHTGLLMVARVLLPLSPSSLLHLSDRAVARGRSWSPSRHGGCPGRWNDDRRATRTRSLVDATRVVGRVRREAGDVAFDLVDQIEGRRRVVNMPAGQGVSDDHARSVDAQMKLLPAAYTASAMFHGRPFTFTHSREPGTVDDEMYACARGEAAKCKVEVLTTP